MIKHENNRSHFTITVKQVLHYMPGGPTSRIHNKIPPHFQGCWGKMKILSAKTFTQFFLIANEKIEKRLHPAWGETDIVYRLSDIVYRPTGRMWRGEVCVCMMTFVILTGLITLSVPRRFYAFYKIYLIFATKNSPPLSDIDKIH